MRAFSVFLLMVMLFSMVWAGAVCDCVSAGEEKSDSLSEVIAPKRSEIKSDETVVFFPTYAHLDENAKTWTVPIHGHIFEAEGISVISDIDDTIKHSRVTDRKALLANTFLRQFEPVPGMAELYRDWAQKGVVFHYVSGSPWQLYTPLAKFIRDEGFPAGSFALKNFRLKDPSSLGLLQSQESHKLVAIESIMKAFPRHRFILIGDSGEQDPEIYATVARKHPRQVAAICIRNVTAAKADDARFKAVRKGLGGVRFVLFDDVGTLGPVMVTNGLGS
ncbi:MAG: phosphatase domain-containing protein [Planctomycetota bacterium]|nr:phosphatase domain-containing protein [Planctomycetota bacterium]